MRRLLTIFLAPALPVLLAMATLTACGDDQAAERGAAASPDTSAVAPAPKVESQTEPADAQSTPATMPRDCGEELSWGTGPRQLVDPNGDAMPLYLFEAGRHDCFDRLVFRVNGPGEVGYYIAYADGEAADAGSGDPLVTAGDATLGLHLLTFVQGGFYDQTGHQPGGEPFGKPGDVIYPMSNPEGLTVVQEVKFGGEYEAETDFAVGLSHQRPFQVTTYVDDNQTGFLIIDIAH
jgi:hypothetical protein